ncbi:Regulation of nuclear pre-mRNA domain-containing protein 1B [Zostera marina]|uniref:Regulation of nuclear pre-mRNA domain-containing protein 1B n=1 Tax=Zostera marina TaxID=29655 RepID=A0A0K9NK80_ZOSMR|nr:Regulation of nuclear pre-mRNA domain-containing protein 1B [Zostera marina]
MISSFSEQELADKLSKLNSSQQCIEILSHWCMFHRENAEKVVQTWATQFHTKDMEHKILFLYIANDILQNSKRNGHEFVSEFWKVLPASLKDVFENGDDHAKNLVSRLISIWKERKVFGSHTCYLSEMMLGNEPLPILDLGCKKHSRSVRILKRDSRSIKVKLSVGETAEKIVSSFHSVLSEHSNEDTDLKSCKDTVHSVEKMGKIVATTCSQSGDPSDPQRSTLIDKLQKHEVILKEYVEKLKSIVTNRETLVSHLKEALKQQECKLESVHTQLQIIESQIEEASNMQRRLKNETSKNSIGESKKSTAAIAAEVADRLAASSHSQQIMSSVLSSFAAAQASKNAKEISPNSNSEPIKEKRLKLENSMPLSNNPFVVVQPVSVTAPQQYQTVMHPTPLQQQSQYSLYQPPVQQYFHSTGGVSAQPQYMIGMPQYTYPSQQISAPCLTGPQQMAAQQIQPMTLIQQNSLRPPVVALQPPMVPNQNSIQTNLQSMLPNQQTVPVNMQRSVLSTYRRPELPITGFYQNQPL